MNTDTHLKKNTTKFIIIKNIKYSLICIVNKVKLKSIWRITSSNETMTYLTFQVKIICKILYQRLSVCFKLLNHLMSWISRNICWIRKMNEKFTFILKNTYIIINNDLTYNILFPVKESEKHFVVSRFHLV